MSFTYQRREPHNTVLYQTIRDHLNDFLSASTIDGKRIPSYIEEEFRSYLRCGILQYGFTRRKCEKCDHYDLLPFSCKKRGFCPSCSSRRMSESVVHLMDSVLPERATRQWVITLPIPLRYLVATDKKIGTEIHSVVMNEVHNYYTSKGGVKNSRTGSITFIQRFGTLLNLNPHFHLIALDGVYMLNASNKVIFKNLTEPTEQEVTTVINAIKRSVIRLLTQKGLLAVDSDYIDAPSDPLFEESPALGSASKASVISRIALGQRAGLKVRFISNSPGDEEEKAEFKGKQCAALSGFSLHCATRIKARDRAGLEKLLFYMARGPIAKDRLTHADDGLLKYELKRKLGDKTHILLSPSELIEKLAALIPPPGINSIRYNGVFAPGSYWLNEVVKALKSAPKKEITSEAGSSGLRMSWSYLLKRVFNLNMDLCPKCGGSMKLISAIMERGVIKMILEHIGMSTDPPDRPSKKRLYEETLLNFNREYDLPEIVYS